VSFPSDGKFLNVLLGMMEPGSAYGYPYSFWAPVLRFSKPDERRTVAQLVDSAAIFAAAKKPSDEFIRTKCHSVITMPVKFAILSPRDLLDTFPPGV